MDEILCIHTIGGRIRLTLQVESDDDQFTAACAELGVASCGDTIDQAMSNIRDAVAVYLEGSEELGERDRVFRERGITIRRFFGH